MSISQKDCKALVIASSHEMRTNLSEMAFAAGIKDVSSSDGKNIREIIPTAERDVIIWSLPLEDAFGLEAVSHMSRACGAAQVIFVPSKIYDEVCGKIGHLGVMVFPRSISENVAVNAIKTAVTAKSKIDELKEENALLRETVNEMKLVNRAKCVLIEYLRISEKDAHRQMQKRAMDRRATLTEVAADILKTYEYHKSDK